MAAPLVAGAALLLRQYFAQGWCPGIPGGGVSYIGAGGCSTSWGKRGGGGEREYVVSKWLHSSTQAKPGLRQGTPGYPDPYHGPPTPGAGGGACFSGVSAGGPPAAPSNPSRPAPDLPLPPRGLDFRPILFHRHTVRWHMAILAE